MLTAPGTLGHQFPESAPSRGSAVLRPTHCGVYGTDPHMYSGHLTVPMPLVMGHEFSGVLEGCGPDFPLVSVYGQDLRFQRRGRGRHHAVVRDLLHIASSRGRRTSARP